MTSSEITSRQRHTSKYGESQIGILKLHSETSHISRTVQSEDIECRRYGARHDLQRRAIREEHPYRG
jgi:hypothetical protein